MAQALALAPSALWAPVYCSAASTAPAPAWTLNERLECLPFKLPEDVAVVIEPCPEWVRWSAQ